MPIVQKPPPLREDNGEHVIATRLLNPPRVARSSVLSTKEQTSFDPREFCPPVDVVEELKRNLCLYYPLIAHPDSIGIVSFPAILKTNLDRVRARAYTACRSSMRNKPGLHPTAACCIEYGLRAICQHPDIAALIEMKTRFDNSDFESAKAQAVVASFFDSFQMEVTVASGSKKRLNINLPCDTKALLARIAGELGMSAASLAVLAIMTTLSSQPAVHKDDQESMAKHVSEFMETAHLRAAGCAALMGAYTVTSHQ